MSGVRFLVVEDDLAFGENLLELIELSGFTGELTRSAAAARVAAAARRPDVALVDLGLPDARGLDLVLDLKRLAPLMTAIVLTEQPTVGSARDAIRSGASAYLLKDGDPRELEAVVRRAAEQASLAGALRESEARYAALVEHAPLGIALVRGHHYTFANARFAAIFGYAGADQVFGLPIEAPFADSERTRVRASLRLDGKLHDAADVRLATRRRDGSPLSILVTLAPLEIDGGDAIQLLVRDMSREDALTRELDDARERILAQERLAALGEMVAGIAHEVRNPLQGIAWGRDELRAFDLPPAAREPLTKIERGIREIDAIVTEVLDFARPMRLDRMPFSIVDLLEATREDVQATADGARVALVIEASPSVTHASIDALKVKQALVNLVRNAIDASPAGARVLVRARSGPGGGTAFEVEDEGAGIPVELREKVFLPFVTTKVKGTGLGLPIVRRIVEAHGGSITLEARRPKGTVARLVIPREP